MNAAGVVCCAAQLVEFIFLWLSAFRPTRPPWVVVGASSSQHARSALAGAMQRAALQDSKLCSQLLRFFGVVHNRLNGGPYRRTERLVIRSHR